MDHETMRTLIGTILLWAMGIAAAAFLIRKNWAQIKEICLDDNGKFDPIGGLEKKFSQSGEQGGSQSGGDNSGGGDNGGGGDNDDDGLDKD